MICEKRNKAKFGPNWHTQVLPTFIEPIISLFLSFMAQCIITGPIHRPQYYHFFAIHCASLFFDTEMKWYQITVAENTTKMKPHEVEFVETWTKLKWNKFSRLNRHKPRVSSMKSICYPETCRFSILATRSLYNYQCLLQFKFYWSFGNLKEHTNKSQGMHVYMYNVWFDQNQYRATLAKVSSNE